MSEFMTFNGDVNKVRTWLKTNDDVNEALCYSAANGHIEAVHEIIKAGATFNRDLLIISSEYEQTKVISELIKAGIDIHTNNDFALWWCAESGYLEIVRELIKAGADIHADNDAALRWSVFYGHLEIVRELIKAGANIHIYSNYALWWSAKTGRLEMMRELIKAGANVYDNDNDALCWSVINRNLKITRELLKYHSYTRIIRVNDLKYIYMIRTMHYTNIISIIFNLPCELYDEIAQFI